MKGFRTLIFNGIAVALPLIGEVLAFLDVFDWRSILPPENAGWLILGIGVLNIILRFVTTTPVGKRW